MPPTADAGVVSMLSAVLRRLNPLYSQKPHEREAFFSFRDCERAAAAPLVADLKSRYSLAREN